VSTYIEHLILDWVKMRQRVEIRVTDDIFMTAGVDSLDFVELLEFIRDTTGMVLDIDALEDLTSLRTAVGLSEAFQIGKTS